MRPQPAVAVYHRLYLKQLEGNRGGRLLEIAPVSFDYQGLIVVDTELLATDDGTVVCQSYSCGCGPQPLIRAGLLERVVPWAATALRRLLAASGDPRDRELAQQRLVPELLLVSVEEGVRPAVRRAVAERFGRELRVRFFGER